MSLNDIDAANAVAVNEGDAGGHVIVLAAYNATAIVLGGGGGHLNEQDAINEIATDMGGANMVNILDGLHEILVQRGDATVFENIRDALDAWALTSGVLANTVFPTVAQGFVVGSKAKDVATNNGVALGTLATKDAGDFAGTDDFALPSTIARADDVAWQLAGWQIFDDFVAARPLCGDATSKLTLTNATTVTLTNSAGGSVTWTISALSTATVYFFVLTCDGSDSSNFELFINDVSEGTKTLADSSFDVATIGQAGGANHLGEITGVGFWSAVLSTAQNTELYNSGTPLPHASWSAGIDTNLTEVYDFIPLPDPWTVGNAQINFDAIALREYGYAASGQFIVLNEKPAVNDSLAILDKVGGTFARKSGRSLLLPFSRAGNILYCGWADGVALGDIDLGILKNNTNDLRGRGVTGSGLRLVKSSSFGDQDLQLLFVQQDTGGLVVAQRLPGQLPCLFLMEPQGAAASGLRGSIVLNQLPNAGMQFDDAIINDLGAPFNVDKSYLTVDVAAPSSGAEHELNNSMQQCMFLFTSNGGSDAATVRLHYVDASNYVEMRFEADGSVVLRTRVAAVNTDDTLYAAGTVSDNDWVRVIKNGASLGYSGEFISHYVENYADEITAAMLAEKTVHVTQANGSMTNLMITDLYLSAASRTVVGGMMTVTENLPPLTGLISYLPCVEPFWGNEQAPDLAETIGGTHADAAIQWSLGVNFVASTDDPTWVSDPATPSVGLDFDGGDHLRAIGTKTATGDFLVQFAILFDSLTNETLIAGNSGDDYIRVVDSTTLRVRIAGANHDFTIAALGTTKINLFTVKREGAVLQARVNGVTNTEITGVSADTFAMDDLCSDNTPGNFTNGKLAQHMAIQASYTDAAMDAEETRLKSDVKSQHSLVDGDFA